MYNRIFSLAILALLLGLFAEKTNAQVSGTKPELVMYRHNGGGVTPAPAISGNTLGVVRWKGLTAISNIRTGASIWSTASLVAPGNIRADLVFSTSTNLADPQLEPHKRMIINSDGLVGIGTQLPVFHLDVVGNTHTSGDFWGRIHFDNNPLDDAPNTYFNQAYFERKMRSVLSVPAVAGANNFGGTLTLSPGGGAYDHQLFFGQDGIYNRREVDGGAAWTAAWEKLLTSGDINGRPNLVARFLPPNSPSSKLGDGQVFDNGSNVVIGGIPAGPSPVPVFAASDMLTVNGNSYTTGNANVGTNTNIAGNAAVVGSTTTGSLSVTNDATVNGTSRLIGKVAIGANPVGTPGSHSLYVGGSIIAEEVVVKLKASWPDYVFAQAHAVQPLSEVEAFIQKENHLPGVPSAAEVAENGLSLGAMQQVQMEKIEELYLHMIAMEKEMNAVKAENAALKARLEQSEKRN